MQPRFLMTLFAISSCMAQTTWTVDDSGGAQFTTIQAAVQAASDGDTILVQPGLYFLNFTLTKGVAILGGVATQVDGLLTISGINPNARVALSHLVPSVGSQSPVTDSFRIAITNCSGSVHCESLSLAGWSRLSNGRVAALPTLTISNSALVTLHRCDATGMPGMSATNTPVAMSESTMGGLPSDLNVAYSGQAGEAILATGCQVDLTSCTLFGGFVGEHMNPPGANAMTCVATQVTAAATQFLGGSGMGAPGGNGRSLVLDVASHLEHDATCQFPDSIWSTPGTVAQVAMCMVTGAAAGPGGSAAFTMAGPAGDAAALFVAMPALPYTLPLGVAWLDPTTVLLLQVGTLPLPNAMLPIPAAAQRGTAFSAQAGLLHLGIANLGPSLTTIVP